LPTKHAPHKRGWYNAESVGKGEDEASKALTRKISPELTGNCVFLQNFAICIIRTTILIKPDLLDHMILSSIDLSVQ
jgi:hypothetical protein